METQNNVQKSGYRPRISEHQRIDAFELRCWRRLLRVPWTARRSNRFILKEISPRCSLEGMMLKLKLQYFGHLIWRTESLEKTLMLGKIEGKTRRGQQRMRWLDSITDSVDMDLSKFCEIVEDRGAWCAAVHEVTNSWTQFSDWTATMKLVLGHHKGFRSNMPDTGGRDKIIYFSLFHTFSYISCYILKY